MNDPWDVKSVRLSDHYISCLKLNGVPLLPPVLSKECRKEMQYYKLLAKEVEKRISLLQPYVMDSDTESTEDKTDAPELPPHYEQLYEIPKEDIQAGFDININKITAYTNILENSPVEDNSNSSELHDSMSKNLNKTEANHNLSCQSPKFLFDLSLNIHENGKDLLEKVSKNQVLAVQPTDPPERDYTPKKNAPNKIQKELLFDMETSHKNKKEQKKVTKDLSSFNIDMDNIVLNQSDPFPDMSMEDGPPSLGAKSFTGSLNNIHRESVKVSCKLIRQRSYTVLNPSPQLLAHLKVQSITNGVDVTSISMSDSQSNLGVTKKRRSWDLESAKVKWSSMALELKSKTATSANCVNKNQIFRTVVNKNRPTSPTRAKSVTQDRSRRGSLPNKALPKSEPTQKAKKSLSPVRNVPSNRTIKLVKEPISKPTIQKKTQSPNQQAVNHQTPSNKQPAEQKLILEPEDPAARVRELYEKIQSQQLIQMANLVEKQKREQILLQQVFEEQNSILYKQLKTICPKSPIEVKEAWGDKLSQEIADRGPVSLSQLINPKSEKANGGPLTSMLNETHSQINKCDMILRKSRDMTTSLRKQQSRRSPNERSSAKPHNPRSPPEGSRTRTHSPNLRHTAISRKLDYDTSASSDREFDPILTDRTNDTLAGLNVSFPTDSEDGSNPSQRKELTMIHCPAPGGVAPRSSTDSAIRSLEETIHNSINTAARNLPPRSINGPATPQQLAAADTIVAYAKGYLVRRLMRTERVQATVQTIKDALLCALQLHQDRAGIRGADVDLHRRLIQQITAACYSLHDSFVASTPAERCALIAADRERRRQKPALMRHFRQKSDIMSQSHSGAFPARAPRSAASLMTQSNYEIFSGNKIGHHMPSPRRRPWR